MGTGAAHTAIGVEAFRAADKIEAEKEVKKVALNLPAFPINERDSLGDHYQTHLGMTLRDYFAATVIAVLYDRMEQGTDLGKVAKAAYSMADAMLQERNK